MNPADNADYVRCLLCGAAMASDLAASHIAAHEATEPGSTSFTCPRCGRVSHNYNDMVEGYCGHCHDWTRER